MSISGWAQTAENWLVTHVPGADLLMLIGAVMAVVTALLLLVWVLRLSVRVLSTLANAGSSGATAANSVMHEHSFRSSG